MLQERAVFSYVVDKNDYLKTMSIGGGPDSCYSESSLMFSNGMALCLLEPALAALSSSPELQLFLEGPLKDLMNYSKFTGLFFTRYKINKYTSPLYFFHNVLSP